MCKGSLNAAARLAIQSEALGPPGNDHPRDDGSRYRGRQRRHEVLVRFPQLQDTKSARITRDFNDRFSRLQGEHVMEWLAITDPADLQAFFVENAEHSVSQLVYEDFTHFKMIPWKGRFFNFVDAGYREVSDQGPWPPMQALASTPCSVADVEAPQEFPVVVVGGGGDAHQLLAILLRDFHRHRLVEPL
jgi:hypothetical protein